MKMWKRYHGNFILGGVKDMLHYRFTEKIEALCFDFLIIKYQ